MSEAPAWAAQVAALLARYEGRTRTHYAASLALFCGWYVGTYGAEPDAVTLTDAEVRDFRAYLSGVKGLKAATVNTHLAPLRALARELGRPLHVKSVAAAPAAVVTLDARELGRLLAQLGRGGDWLARRDVALANVLARAGLRVAEAVALETGDLELAPRGGSLLVRQGKGLKERLVPLPAEARRALADYLAVRPTGHGPRLFLSRTGRPLTKRDAHHVIATAARLAGLAQPVGPHTLRHYYATRFLEQHPGDIATLARLMGHTNIATTTRYLHPSARRLQELVEEL